MNDDEELRGTIPFEDIDLEEDEGDDFGELLDAVNSGDSVETYDPNPRGIDRTIRRAVPEDIARAAKPAEPALENARTTRREPWDVGPPEPAEPADAPVPPGEKTTVRKVPRVFREETRIHRLQDPAPTSQHWIDCHAVVDADGRLKIPAKIASRLQSGEVIEIRIASTFVDE